MMTLGGMAAAVALVIDDTIVMVEHIVRRLLAGNDDHHSRVMLAVQEFTTALAAGSSASTILLFFFPLAFFSGVTGAFFKALSLTMAASLIISFVVAWLAVPLLADRWLNERDAAQKGGTADRRGTAQIRGGDAAAFSHSWCLSGLSPS